MVGYISSRINKTAANGNCQRRRIDAIKYDGKSTARGSDGQNLTCRSRRCRPLAFHHDDAHIESARDWALWAPIYRRLVRCIKLIRPLEPSTTQQWRSPGKLFSCARYVRHQIVIALALSNMPSLTYREYILRLFVRRVAKSKMGEHSEMSTNSSVFHVQLTVCPCSSLKSRDQRVNKKRLFCFRALRRTVSISCTTWTNN